MPAYREIPVLRIQTFDAASSKRTCVETGVYFYKNRGMNAVFLSGYT
ncbi:MAG: hypothetical protein ACPK85_17030 [Methanosarcina sp.]